jgi:dsRNA-specific ribonuclease
VFYVSLFVNGKKASDAWGFSKKEAQQRAAGDFLRWANKHQQKVKQFL